MSEQTLVELFAELRAAAPGPTVQPNSQDWATLGGAVAHHLIDRHADNWADAELMMDEFAASRVLAERERCALLADKATFSKRQLIALIERQPIKPSRLAEQIRKDPK